MIQVGQKIRAAGGRACFRFDGQIIDLECLSARGAVVEATDLWWSRPSCGGRALEKTWPADFRFGSKCEELGVSKVGPLYPTKRTSMKGVATSLMGQ